MVTEVNTSSGDLARSARFIHIDRVPPPLPSSFPLFFTPIMITTPKPCSTTKRHIRSIRAMEVAITPLERQTIESAARTWTSFNALSNELHTKAMLWRLTYELAQKTTVKNNFFRILTNDCCETRHGIIEPPMVEEFCPLDNRRHDEVEMQAGSETFPIGMLPFLPQEIMQDILCRFLDLKTLTKIRSVSRGLQWIPFHSTMRSSHTLQIASALPWLRM